jgi:cyclopropane-fatty-acyl-phospholipid synthase
MPSHDLLDHVRGPLRVEQRWVVPGAHYARTALAWRENLEARPREVAAALAGHGDGATAAGVERWRVFFLACEELFAFRGGTEWHVSHVTLRPT